MKQILLWLIVFCMSMGLAFGVAGQATLEVELLSNIAVSKQQVEESLSRVEENTALTPEETERLRSQYQVILKNIEEQTSFDKKADYFRGLYQDADTKAQEIQKKLEQRKNYSPTHAEEALDEALSPEELQNQLAQQKTTHETVRDKLQGINKELNDPLNSITAIRQRLSNISEEQQKLSEESIARVADSSPEHQQAREWLLQSKEALLNAEAQMLELKLSSSPMRARWLTADKAYQLEIEREVEARVEHLQNLLNEKRTTKAQDSMAATEALSKSGHTLSQKISEYVEKNKSLSLELSRLAESLSQATQRSQIAKDQLDFINNRYRSVKQRLEIAGLSEALGHVLSERRDDMPKVASYRKEHEALVDEVSSVALRRLELQSELNYQYQQGQDKTLLLESLQAESRPEQEPFIDKVVENRYQLLRSLDTDNATYMRVLSDLDYDLVELIKVTGEFDEFILRKLMWVRTSSPIYGFTLDDIRYELDAFWTYYREMNVEEALIGALPPLWGWLLFLIALVILVSKRWMLQQQQLAMNQMLRSFHASTKWALKYLGLVALQSAPVAIAAFMLSRMVDVAIIPKAHESLVNYLWLYLFCADYICKLLKPNGFVYRYLGWPKEVVVDLSNGFNRMRRLVVIPLIIITVIPWHIFASKGNGFLGAVFICLIMCGLAYSFCFFLSGRYALFASIKKRRLVRPAAKSQVFIKFLMVAGPVFWAISLLVGYRYASIVLSSRVFETILITPFIYVAYLLAERGLREFQSRVEYNRKYMEAQAQSNEAADGAAGEEGGGGVEDDRARSLDELAVETQKLLRSVFLIVFVVVFGLIWSAVFPALAIFDEVVLWNIKTVADGIDTLQPFTLSSLLFLIVGGFAAFVAVRRLPAFVEMVLLSRMNISNGSRYAITTLMTYALLAVAVTYIGHSIGFGWSKIQWAVAALSVGIGFGLQEIVANFISGLIILFERPIRVGDLVTINGQTGVVHRIQIRATTLRDFDNKELLVPNKEFITSSLLNWTLSDKEVRILLPVGITYGSDVDLALNLLEEAAVEHPEVLENPAPVVTFESFGDNALSLYLRCRIASVDDRLRILTELHKSINEKYLKAGISIAFPQRDLHVDFAAPLEVVLKKPMPKASA